MIPNILSIAGSDPSGGAGIQADIKAISANGGYAMAALTGLTVQNTQGVSAVRLLEPDFVCAQVASVLQDIRVDAVKIGMLGDAGIIRALAELLTPLTLRLVLDPVMVAKSGDRLLRADAVQALRDLLPLAHVVTPNLPEAADLLGQAEAQDRAGMETQARALLALGPRAVLLKGGHLASDEAPDLFVSGELLEWLPARRIATRQTHGTGCTLSAALATQLAGSDPLTAARAAKAYTLAAIAGAARLDVGRGQGPTDHFFAQRSL